VCVGEIISLSWFSKELRNDLSKNNCIHVVILILLVRESIFVEWGFFIFNSAEPRYQPNLLGFLGIDVFACGLRDHEVRINIQRWFGVATQVDPLLLEKKMASFFTNTFKMPYFEFLIGSATQHFTNLMIVAERNEQAIKIGKIKGPIVNSKVIIKHELILYC